jgi:hypothetical protein
VTAPIITAHPVQLTFAAACADVYGEESHARAAGPRRGIAYLVSSEYAATAAQVVGECPLGETLWLRFSGGLRPAQLVFRDEEADCAVLVLRPAIISQLALRLYSGLCQPGDACQTWAASPNLRAPGEVVQALVLEPLGEDELRAPALLLHMVAGAARGGPGEPWYKDLAGCPFLHNGYVVGHLRTVKNHGGMTQILCCAAPYVDALLAARALENSAAPALAQAPPRQPPKASYSPLHYVQRKSDEARALDACKAAAPPLLVFAPERHGKTWFLSHLLGMVKRAGGVAVSVNLERLPAPAWTSLPAFLSELQKRLLERLAEAWNEPHLAKPGALSELPITELFAVVLQRCGPRGFYLGLDQFDTLRDTMFLEGFIALLAEWVERSQREPSWSLLRILLFSSTAPDWLVRPLPARPFTVQPQELPDLSTAQLGALCRLHGLEPSPTEIAQLQALIGGQPYLWRVALYAAALRGETLAGILQQRAGAASLFQPFLATCERRVAAQPGLFPTLLRVLRDQPLEALDRLLLPRLERMGIVRRDSRDARHPEYTLRYPLYRLLLQ